MSRGVFFLERCQDLVNGSLTNINQHVRVRESLHRPDLITLHWRCQSIQWLATIVLLEDFTISDWGHAIIVKLQPPCFAVRLDECEVMATMKITGMHQHAVQLVHPWVRSVCSLVEEFAEINLEWEFVAIVDLSE